MGFYTKLGAGSLCDWRTPGQERYGSFGPTRTSFALNVHVLENAEEKRKKGFLSFSREVKQNNILGLVEQTTLGYQTRAR